MSVVGFDFGNENCVVAVASQRGIDVVLNDESKRETPAIVSFDEKQRFLGTAGAASILTNPKNTISQIKRLLGCQFSDPQLQGDLKSLPFLVTEGPDGYPLIQAQYLGETKTFTPTQVLGMVFSNLKSIAEKNMNAAVVDCCIGIPVYFTDLQRRALIDAATIAGLHPLRPFHETAATAFAYGIYKTDLPNNEPLNIVFVDVGHASMQVCVAAFKKGQLQILAHSFDRSLGGRDFDEVLVQHFAAKFKEEYNINRAFYRKFHRWKNRVQALLDWFDFKKMTNAPDVNVNTTPLPNHGNSGVNALSGEYSTYFKMRVSEVRRSIKVLFEILSRVFENAKPSLRLRAACEKLKKVLSANPLAPLNTECLMDENDVKGVMNREEFEQISIPILKRVKIPLEKAFVEVGVTIENVHSVEVVGSGSRVPAIIKITDFFGKDPRGTMNASECVAKGCALQCAMLSPTFKVREFQVNESFPFSIALSWKDFGSDAQIGVVDNQQRTVVFAKG